MSFPCEGEVVDKYELLRQALRKPGNFQVFEHRGRAEFYSVCSVTGWPFSRYEIDDLQFTVFLARWTGGVERES